MKPIAPCPLRAARVACNPAEKHVEPLGTVIPRCGGRASGCAQGASRRPPGAQTRVPQQPSRSPPGPPRPPPAPPAPLPPPPPTPRNRGRRGSQAPQAHRAKSQTRTGCAMRSACAPIIKRSAPACDRGRTLAASLEKNKSKVLAILRAVVRRRHRRLKSPAAGRRAGKRLRTRHSGAAPGSAPRCAAPCGRAKSCSSWRSRMLGCSQRLALSFRRRGRSGRCLTHQAARFPLVPVFWPVLGGEDAMTRPVLADGPRIPSVAPRPTRRESEDQLINRTTLRSIIT